MTRLVDHEIEAVLRAGGGAFRAGDLPGRLRTLQRRVAAGQLTQVCPGVLVAGGRSAEPVVLARALTCWRPDAVLTGRLAAQLTFWPQLAVHEVTASVPGRLRGVPAPYRLVSERLPSELVSRVDGLALTLPALTALELAATDEGAAIDEALRRGACRLGDLHAALALTPHRQGNRTRRAVLHDSRDSPWSPAERRLHVLLRRARLTGWVANHPVSCGAVRYYLDVAFVADQVAVEVDGYAVHSRQEQFHRDRRRWTDLQAEGWAIVHVSWEQLTGDPGWVVERLRQVLQRARSGR